LKGANADVTEITVVRDHCGDLLKHRSIPGRLPGHRRVRRVVASNCQCTCLRTYGGRREPDLEREAEVRADHHWIPRRTRRDYELGVRRTDGIHLEVVYTGVTHVNRCRVRAPHASIAYGDIPWNLDLRPGYQKSRKEDIDGTQGRDAGW